MSRCPFCKRDPFHRVHNGLGYEAVAVVCCDLGVDLYSNHSDTAEAARQALLDMRHHSPRRKARAMAALRAAGLREPSKLERRLDRLEAERRVTS